MDTMENDMRITPEDELLVRSFFEDNMKEIEDDGFSERVMRRLPSPVMRLNRIWTAICSCVGLLWLVHELSRWQPHNVRNAVARFVWELLEDLSGHVMHADLSSDNLLMVAATAVTVTIIMAYAVWEERRNL